MEPGKEQKGHRDKRTDAVTGRCWAGVGMGAWGRGLSVASLQAGQGDLAVLALPCVMLRWLQAVLWK